MGVVAGRPRSEPPHSVASNITASVSPAAAVKLNSSMSPGRSIDSPCTVSPIANAAGRDSGAVSMGRATSQYAPVFPAEKQSSSTQARTRTSPPGGILNGGVYWDS